MLFSFAVVLLGLPATGSVKMASNMWTSGRRDANPYCCVISVY